MRLSEHDVRIIVRTAAQQFGSGASVWVFGSRVDDAKRGGDIDLFIEVKHKLQNKSAEAAAFMASLQYQLGDQKIDVVIDDGSDHQIIYDVARQEGQPC